MSTQAQASAALAGAEVISLRDYQAGLVTEVRASLKAGRRRVLAYLPTGGGKTRVATAITQMTLSKSKGRVVVLANRKQLVHQFAAALRAAGLDVGILQGENTHGLHHRVVVASIDTIHARNCIFDDVACSSSTRRTPAPAARSTAPCCSATTACPASA
jgi:superfamily II DNA or RNA helicase